MTNNNPKNPFQHDGGELPDYSDECIRPPAKDTWFKDPLKKKTMLRLVMAVIFLLGMVPVYRSLKEWRASSLIGKSGEAFALGDSEKGVSLLKQALALAPGSPRIQHAVELYDARAGDKASLEKLAARMRAGDSDDLELLGIAEIASTEDGKELAREALGLISSKSAKRNYLRRSLLEASLTARERSPNEAADFCILRADKAPSQGDAGYLRIQAALDLLLVRDTPDSTRIQNLLQGVISERSAASITAWRFMAKLLLAPPDGIHVPNAASEAARLSKTFNLLSAGKPADELMAADLEIMGDPQSKPMVVARLIKARRLASRDAQLDLARWLNGKGCQKEVIELAGGDRPANDTDWLLIVLDAKSTLGNLKDIPSMLSTPAGSGIPDAVRHLFLARIAMMNGNDSLAEEEWRNVGASLHLEKPETLAYIAGYEEQIGAYDRAARTYREMADREATRIPGLIGLIRCQPRDTSAAKLIPLYEELVSAAPAMGDARCDLAYLRLLSGNDILKSSSEAQVLLSQQPYNLARISVAALGKLREGDLKGALDLYNGKTIDWVNAPEQWRIIWFAVLKSNGKDEGYDGGLFQWNTSTLRPEERALVASVAGSLPQTSSGSPQIKKKK
jgi:hypothetical protein